LEAAKRPRGRKNQGKRRRRGIFFYRALLWESTRFHFAAPNELLTVKSGFDFIETACLNWPAVKDRLVAQAAPDPRILQTRQLSYPCSSVFIGG
jgi:hypothetical protein